MYLSREAKRMQERRHSQLEPHLPIFQLITPQNPVSLEHWPSSSPMFIYVYAFAHQCTGRVSSTALRAGKVLASACYSTIHYSAALSEVR
jgi:hypothetical protein